MKNTGIIAAWIGALLLVGWLLFFFTQPLRNNVLKGSVNNMLTANGLERQLDEPMGRTAAGLWWSVVNSTEKAVVFAVMDGGIAVPCIAFVDGTTVDVHLLSPAARLKYDRLPKGLIHIFINRIQKEINL